MRFKGLDLNLLVALDTLVETRSVSRSAERMNLSQPAMSSALGRLRNYFGDPILVAHGKRMYPTAYAESLLPQVRESLRTIEALIGTSTLFDPATSQRNFRLVASDYISAAVIVPLVARLSEIAPHVRIEIILPTDQGRDQIEQGLVDLLITPEQFISPDLPADLLCEERHVVVGWKGNPMFARKVTADDIYAAGHVSVAMGNTRTPAYADHHLNLMGRHRKIEVIASSFTMVPWLLLNTMRVALMHERLARAMSAYFPIAFAPVPFPFPIMREMAQYHSARAADGGLTWLRQQMREIADNS
jgi:LysR family transcriptional regulator, nod-box dependent transcriptional activator